MELLLSVAESAHRLGIGKTLFFSCLRPKSFMRFGLAELIPIAELERFVAQPRTRSHHSPRAASVRVRRGALP
jgi:hypothetical protein